MSHFSWTISNEKHNFSYHANDRDHKLECLFYRLVRWTWLQGCERPRSNINSTRHFYFSPTPFVTFEIGHQSSSTFFLFNLDIFGVLVVIHSHTHTHAHTSCCNTSGFDRTKSRPFSFSPTFQNQFAKTQNRITSYRSDTPRSDALIVSREL